MGKEPKTLSPEVAEIFNTYYWRGNVRELRNVIERAIIFSKGRIIDKDLLPPEMIDGNKETANHRKTMHIQSSGHTLEENLAAIESRLIGAALQKAKGNKTRAAKLLGISRFALNRRLERLQYHNLKDTKKH